MEASDIRRIAVIGCGTIGASWAARFLAAGLEVAATDPQPGAEARLRAFLAAAWPDLATLGLTGGRGLDEAMQRLSWHVSPAGAARGAGMVQENAPERLEVKQALLAELEGVLDPRALIASSTSGIMPTPMQAKMAHPGRLVVGHPFNPPHLIPLVEVVGGARTDPAAVDLALAFYRRIGKRPIRLNREIAGHVANRLQAALWREAVNLVARDVASLADVDAALVAGPGLRWALMGPHLTFHLAGGAGGMAHFLDHLGPAVEGWWADLGAPHLDAATGAALVAGVAEETGGAAVAELAARRDRALLEVLRVPPVIG